MLGVFLSCFLLWPFLASAGMGLVFAMGAFIAIMGADRTWQLGLFAHGSPYFVPLAVVLVFGIPAFCVWLARWQHPRKILALSFVLLTTFGAPALMAHEKAFGFYYTFEKNYVIGMVAIAAIWLIVFAIAGFVVRRVLDGPAGHLYQSHWPFMLIKRQDTFLD